MTSSIPPESLGGMESGCTTKSRRYDSAKERQRLNEYQNQGRKNVHVILSKAASRALKDIEAMNGWNNRLIIEQAILSFRDKLQAISNIHLSNEGDI